MAVLPWSFSGKNFYRNHNHCILSVLIVCPNFSNSLAKVPFNLGHGSVIAQTFLSRRDYLSLLGNRCWFGWYILVKEAPELLMWPIHDDVIKWKQFPRYWPFERGIHRSPVNSPHKGQWRGALMFSLIYARINSWINNREAGDLRRHPTHCDVIVMISSVSDAQMTVYDPRLYACATYNSLPVFSFL